MAIFWPGRPSAKGERMGSSAIQAIRAEIAQPLQSFVHVLLRLRDGRSELGYKTKDDLSRNIEANSAKDC